MSDKKPDNVADNPGILPYGSNVGAPSIQVFDISNWKQNKVQKVNKEFEGRYNELKTEYEKLIEEYKWNELVYSAKFNFEPVIGELYHLYYGKNDNVILSLIEPNQWKQKYIGTFKYNHDNKWIKTEWNY